MTARARLAWTLRGALVSLREMLLSGGPLVLLAAALVVGAYLWLKPTPPRQVRLATGPEQSAYDTFGARYAQALAAHGFEVVRVPSEGSQHNLRLLREGRADLGFVQGGSDDPGMAAEDDTALVSLGSLFLEPVWLFYREDALRRRPPAGPRVVPAAGPGPLAGLTGLGGLRVNVGTPGSGVPALVNRLLALNRVEPGTLRLSHLPPTPAVVAFLDRQLDALVFASAPEAPMVQMLLQTPGVRLLDVAQSEAYARRLPFLSPVLLPRGVVDLAQDLPPRDVHLVAPTTTLLARVDTHPALLQLFAQAALGLHSQPGWFNRAREFPSLAQTEWPVAREAERTYGGGVPLLQRYLPFRLANLVERMWIALGLIVAIVLPLSRVVPPLYAFRIRSRVFRWYGRLRDIEDRLAAGLVARESLREELDALDRLVEKVTVPLSYADELYALRQNIALVRQRVVTG